MTHYTRKKIIEYLQIAAMVLVVFGIAYLLIR